ncbi:MAG: hypothetical protein JNM84_15015 [Planctomycetes bacterium]|nr:hypothetical protein [Planctomycetota bacterium]
MAYDPRTLAILSEVLHAPVQHDARKLQGLHAALFQDATLNYANFALVPGGATLSNPTMQPGQVSAVSFLIDRFQVREELGSNTPEEFGRRLEGLSRLASEHLSLQRFLAQQVLFRSLVQPRHFADAREYLAHGMWSIPRERLAVIGRPAQLLGYRAVYPQTPTDPSLYQLRVESFQNDPRSLFIELGATFAATQADFAPTPTELRANVEKAHGFLHRRVLPFLEQFDQPQPSA